MTFFNTLLIGDFTQTLSRVAGDYSVIECESGTICINFDAKRTVTGQVTGMRISFKILHLLSTI